MSSNLLAPGVYGRYPEIRSLDALLRRAKGGRSGVLVLRGEAGIGKTVLLSHAVARVSGMRVAQIAGTESEMELAFAGLHQLCAPMLDSLPRLPAPQRDALGVALGLREGDAPDRFLVGLAVLTLLSEVAGDQPLVCVVDDAQWLDRSSLQALAFAARRLLADPVALIFAVREPSDERVLTGLPEMQVPGLNDRDARTLLSTALPGPLDERVRERVIAESLGNPLALLTLPLGQTPAQLAGGYGLTGGSGLVSRIERSFLDQVEALPPDTRGLLLLAAADPIGEAGLLWRAAERMAVGPEAALAAEAAALIVIGARVHFRHPLVRSAVYRAAPVAERRAVHRALGEATDPATDADQHAWHRAHASSRPDEDVAEALERSAGRARARGGAAASAAFLAYAAELSPDPARRAARAVAAAGAKLEAGAPGEVLELIATADALPLGDMQRARIDLLRAQTASAVHRGRDAPPLLLAAAERLRPLDPALARETYLEALSAAIFAGRFSAGGEEAVRAAARAALDAPPPPEPVRAIDLVLDGLAVRLTEGYLAAVAPLKAALAAFRAEDAAGVAPMRWYDLVGRVALDLWDFAAYEELAVRQVRLLRDAGHLTALPLALTYCAGVYVNQGRPVDATALLEESEAITGATGAPPPRYIEPLVTAYKGQEEVTLTQVGTITRSAGARGEGRTISLMGYAAAVLHNGLGKFPQALAATENAAEHDDLGMRNYALLEMVEAAARSGRTDRAAEAAREIAAQGEATGTPLGLGVAARSRALAGEGPDTDALYREAIGHLAGTHDLTEQGRAHLVYGEWLRRENRTAEAREQLGRAHAIFTEMRADGFAERARRELLVAGEASGTPPVGAADTLTPQESAIAHLARDGYTNSEIATQLFISPRTVEWHLGKIFAKLDITSRRRLRSVLRDTAAPSP